MPKPGRTQLPPSPDPIKDLCPWTKLNLERSKLNMALKKKGKSWVVPFPTNLRPVRRFRPNPCPIYILTPAIKARRRKKNLPNKTAHKISHKILTLKMMRAKNSSDFRHAIVIPFDMLHRVFDKKPFKGSLCAKPKPAIQLECHLWNLTYKPKRPSPLCLVSNGGDEIVPVQFNNSSLLTNDCNSSDNSWSTDRSKSDQDNNSPKEYTFSLSYNQKRGFTGALVE